MNDLFNREEWKFHNLEKLETALSCLYETIINDEKSAGLRGDAITAIDKIIIDLRGESAIQKIESVPFSARLTASKDHNLKKLAAAIRETGAP